MKNLFYILTLLLLISCRQRNSGSTTETDDRKNVIAESSILSENKIKFEKYVADGLFLKGEIRLFDGNLNSIGKLEIDKITLVQILEKSFTMYNIENSTENCAKAYFLKVEYLNKNYIVFGKDIYKINNDMKFNVQSENQEKLILFPITNFKMGASDEDGLTGCNDYSLLVLQNETKGQYSLMKYPENEDIHGKSACKYAVLFHDDGSNERIYKVSIKQDTLVIGIKAWYQEGGSIFNLKANLSADFPDTRISNRIRFDYDDLKKMDDFK